MDRNFFPKTTSKNNVEENQGVSRNLHAPYSLKTVAPAFRSGVK